MNKILVMLLLFVNLVFSQSSLATGSVRVGWSAIANDLITDYKVFYSTVGGVYSDYVMVKQSDVCVNSQCSYLVSGLEENQTWHFVVKAVDVNGFESINYSPEAIEYIQNQYNMGAVTANELISGLDSGQYSLSVYANGIYDLILLGNTAPTVTISADKSAYLYGETATVNIIASDQEGDTLSYTCFDNNVEMNGFTTESLVASLHDIYCNVSDGVNIVSSDILKLSILNGPHLGLPSQISLMALPGDNFVSTTFTVSNLGDGSMQWNVDTTSNILSFDSQSGINNGNVELSANVGGLATGDYYGDVIVTSSDVDNSPVTVPVKVSVMGVLPPNTASIDLEFSNNQHLYIEDALQKGLDVTGDITIEGWIKVESFAENAIIIGKINGNGESGYSLNVLDTGLLVFHVFETDKTRISRVKLSNPITAGTWYHVAGTFDSLTGQCDFYLNGIKQTSLSTNISVARHINNNADPFRIGSNQEWSGGNRFDGKVDEARVWNVVRSADEINDNMFHQLYGSEPGLVGYWRFNNDNLDLTANGNNLKKYSAPIFSSDIPAVP